MKTTKLILSVIGVLGMLWASSVTAADRSDADAENIAMYPWVATTDGKPMNAQHDYAIRMTKAELPPAIAFWSLMLYDAKEGLFIPNKQKKYSVGENAGMNLNASGGIEVYIAAKQPKGVPAENWLPITREDLDLEIILRVYNPDLKKMKSWKAPKAEKLSK